MNSYFTSERCAIWLSIFIALLLQIMPWPREMHLFRPNWALLVVTYWALVLPHRINISTAFIVGFLVDMLSGSTLGVRSFAFSLIAYLVAFKFQILRNLALWQQAVMVVLFSLLTHLAVFWSAFLTTEVSLRPVLFWNSLIDGILWPWVFLLLDKVRFQPTEQ